MTAFRRMWRFLSSKHSSDGNSKSASEYLTSVKEIMSWSDPSIELASRKPLWLDLQPVDIQSRWRHNRKSTQVVNSHLVCDPTIRQPGFDLPRQQWSLLNRFRTEQGHCGACRRKWRLTDTVLCPCGETQTMSHIVESCPLTKLNGGLSRLHSADEDAASWLTSYGSWHTYEKNSWHRGRPWPPAASSAHKVITLILFSSAVYSAT